MARTRQSDTLTHEDLLQLTAQGKAILDGETLITRTKFYQYDDAQNVYVCTHAGLRVQHQQGMRWDARLKRFVLCQCATCWD